MTAKYQYRVTGDSIRMVYSRHRSEQTARRAARSLARRWGNSHPGTEPRVEVLTDNGWLDVVGYCTPDREC